MNAPGRLRAALGFLAWSVCLLLLVAGVATLRAVLDGEREIAASDAAFDADDLHAAIQHARRAASAYAPGAPHVERGYERLLAIARGAEATGQPAVAVLAWQAQRAAVLESRSFFQPFPARLEEADRNLSRLEAARTAPEPERAEAALRLFKQSRARAVEQAPWGGLLAGGMLVAALGLAWFARSALGPGGAIRWASGRWGLATFACGAALWALAAYRG
jgi:hypothetical protein